MTPRLPPPHIRRAVALAVPLLLVNGWAVYGQAAWAYDHLLPSKVAAVLFAATVESIAVYLAYEARAALLAGDSSFRLRMASYVAALAAGAMNYSHYAAAWDEPNSAALIFAVLSALSPWLWAVRSRSQRREDLRLAGLVDARAAHFSAARWMHFPYRTWRALRWSIDASEQDPARAWVASRNDKAGGTGNGHGKTKVELAIETVLAYEAEHGRRPSRDKLAELADCSGGTAGKALALTRGN